MEVRLDITKRYSFADYLTWIDDKRRELIDGFVRLMSPAPSIYHQKVSFNISLALGTFFKPKKCKVLYSPIDVRLPTSNDETTDDKIYTVVQPDIIVVCDISKLDEKGCLGAPDLVIEILSPSTAKYDLEIKYNLYELSKVKEYWVVYPNDKALTKYFLQENNKYDEGTLYQFGGIVTTALFKGLKIELKEIFAD